MRVVFANGIPLFHYAKADKAADHFAMIHLGGYPYLTSFR